MDAKAQVGLQGIGCEPASAASLAGVKQLASEGVIGRSQTVVCVLTGHQLKDPKATVGYHSATGDDFNALFSQYGIQTARYPNRPLKVENSLEAITKAMGL